MKKESSAIPVSGLVITLNEELNLPACLDSLSFLDEVFVVDSFSSDDTVGVCERCAHAGVRVWQRRFEDYSSQRNRALQELPWSNEWVLSVDADERVSDGLREEVKALFADGQEPDCAAFMIKRRLYFLGRWIRHCGLYPIWLIRLFRRSRTRYTRTVNEKVVVDGRVGRLERDLIHQDRKGVAAWIDKHNRYSTLEAETVAAERRESLMSNLKRLGIGGVEALFDPLQRRGIMKQLFRRLPWRYLWVFLYMYVLRLGFLDGLPGFYYCMLHATYQLHIAAKTYEKDLRTKPGE